MYAAIFVSFTSWKFQAVLMSVYQEQPRLYGVGRGVPTDVSSLVLFLRVKLWLCELFAYILVLAMLGGAGGSGGSSGK